MHGTASYPFPPLAWRRSGGRLFGGQNSPCELSQYLRCHCFPKLVIKERLNPAELCTPGKYGPVTLLMQWLRDCCTHRGGARRGRERRGRLWGDKDKGKSNLRFPTQPLFTHRACTYSRTERLSCHFQSGLFVCASVCVPQGPWLPALWCPLGTVQCQWNSNVLARSARANRARERKCCWRGWPFCQ